MSLTSGGIDEASILHPTADICAFKTVMIDTSPVPAPKSMACISGRSGTVFRIVSTTARAKATRTGWISPPIALAVGLAFALMLGNPIPEISNKASKILLQWSVVGLGFGMNLHAVWAAGKTGFGFWSAIAIHDTSSVVGAAAKYGEEALNIATTVKLSRALWIFPIVLGLAFMKRHHATKVKLSWFIFAFLAAAGIRTLWPQGEVGYETIKQMAKLGLTLTLFLIGANLSRDAIKTVGIRPMLQGVLLWILVSMAGLMAVQSLLR